MNPATSAVYDALHARSLNDPAGFWAEAAEEIDWFQRWDRVLDDSSPHFYRWFQGGQLNTCQNAVDRHVEAGRDDQPAIIHDSPVTGALRTIRYREMLDLVARFVGSLRGMGVEKGDRVVMICFQGRLEPGVTRRSASELKAGASLVQRVFDPLKVV